MYLDKSFNFVKARKTREIEVPELGCKVIVRELSVAQVAKLDNDQIKQLAMIIVDPDGNLLYQTAEDLANLAEMPATVAPQIFKAWHELNGTSEEAKEEIVKN